MEKVKPNLRYREYYTYEVVRVVDPLQCKLYIKHGVFPVDIYTSRKDADSDKELIVMLFLKKESKPLYEKWLAHELK